MDLPTPSQRPLACEKLEKAAAILHNVLRRVFVKAGKIERAPRIGRHWADAAAARREPVRESVLF